MSADGMLPDDVTEDMVPGNRPGDQHDKACKQHEDAERTWSECGGIGECLCKSKIIAREITNCREIEPACTCADLAAQRASDRADEAYARSRGD